MEIPTGRYKLASDDIACEKFEEEFIILDLGTGTYSALSKSASVFFDGLLAGFDVADMIKHGNRSLDGGENIFGRLLIQLIENNLVIRDDREPAGAVTNEWTDALDAAGDRPFLETFDDLQDLVLSDPIHDVDKTAGWPTVKKDNQG